MGLFKTLGTIIGTVFGGGPGAAIGNAAGSFLEGGSNKGGSSVDSGYGSQGFDIMGGIGEVAGGLAGNLLTSKGGEKAPQEQSVQQQPSQQRMPVGDAGFDLTRYLPKPIDPNTGLPMYAFGGAPGEDILMVSRNTGKPVGTMSSDEAIVPANKSGGMMGMPGLPAFKNGTGGEPLKDRLKPIIPQVNIQSDQTSPKTVTGFANEQDKNDNFLANVDLGKVALNVGRLYMAYQGAKEDERRSRFGVGPGLTSRLLPVVDSLFAEDKDKKELDMFRKKEKIKKEENPDTSVTGALNENQINTLTNDALYGEYNDQIKGRIAKDSIIHGDPKTAKLKLELALNALESSRTGNDAHRKRSIALLRKVYNERFPQPTNTPTQAPNDRLKKAREYQAWLKKNKLKDSDENIQHFNSGTMPEPKKKFRGLFYYDGK